jgi:DDE superfamily endonuclease
MQKIEDLGVEVEHIPGGCTSLCQPIDVGIGKPYKNRMKNQWENWMIDVGVQMAITTPPTRQQFANWCIDSLGSIGTQIVHNSWRLFLL